MWITLALLIKVLQETTNLLITSSISLVKIIFIVNDIDITMYAWPGY